MATDLSPSRIGTLGRDFSPGDPENLYGGQGFGQKVGPGGAGPFLPRQPIASQPGSTRGCVPRNRAQGGQFLMAVMDLAETGCVEVASSRSERLYPPPPQPLYFWVGCLDQDGRGRFAWVGSGFVWLVLGKYEGEEQEGVERGRLWEGV